MFDQVVLTELRYRDIADISPRLIYYRDRTGNVPVPFPFERQMHEISVCRRPRPSSTLSSHLH